MNLLPTAPTHNTGESFISKFSFIWNCFFIVIKIALCRAPLLSALIGLFELPEDDSISPGDHFIEIEDAPSYSPAYSQLAHAQKPQHDPLIGT